MTTHPIIDRLAALSSEELTVADVVHVLGLLDRKPVDGLIKSGALEALKGGNHARGTDPMGREIRHRYSIAAAAVLTYLVKITSGDKAVILEAVSQRFPHHYQLCVRVAKGLPALAPSAPPAPANIVSLRKAKRSKPHSQPPDHPGQLYLFPAPDAASASA